MKPKEVATQWFERVWQQRSKETIYEFMHDQTIVHQEGGGKTIGPDAFEGFFEALLLSFSNFSLEILHVVGDETQACLHWRVRGVHSGPFGPLAPTGEQVDFTGMSFVIVENAKIKEAWDNWDLGSLFAKLAAKNTASEPHSHAA